MAYCVPGLHPRIVLSEGTLQLLGPGEVAAVIAHERGHVHERHGLVMLPMLGLKNLFRWIPYARLAPGEIATLLEMSADDYSARRYDPLTLAGALVGMAASGSAPAVRAFGHWLGCAPKSQPVALELTKLQENCPDFWTAGGCGSCPASGSCGTGGMRARLLSRPLKKRVEFGRIQWTFRRRQATRRALSEGRLRPSCPPWGAGRMSRADLGETVLDAAGELRTVVNSRDVCRDGHTGPFRGGDQ